MNTRPLNTGALIAAFSSLLSIHSAAQSTGDYRSAGTGNWTVAGTWERFNGTEFVAAGIVPSSSDGVITIRTGHTVAVNSTTTADQVVVEAGATLSIPSILNLSDGTGPDLVVNGTLLFNAGTLQGSGLAQVNGGGTFTWNQGTIGSSVVLDLLAGSTTTMNSTAGKSNGGTINNAGTFTMTGGDLTSSNLPAAFNNLPGGVLNLNGWSTNTGTWSQFTNNQAAINKNNGPTLFTFLRQVVNSGTINVAAGELRIFNSNTSENTGTIAFTPPGSVLRLNGNMDLNSGGAITGLDELFLEGGICTVNSANSIPSLPLINIASGLATLDCTAPLTTDSLIMVHGNLRGAGGLTVINGFNWTGGAINNTGVLNLPATCTTVLAQGGNGLSNSGIINNAGTFLMQAGTLSQGTTPCRFNNLPGGMLELNGWASPTGSWVQNVFNQGTINKNNGDVQFTLVFQLTNEPGGVVNVNSGSLSLAPSFSLPVQSGVFNVAEGTSLITSASGIPYAGPEFNNNGTVNATLKFEGGSAQQLNGTGTITSLTINNAAGVDLGGEQTVTNVLTMSNGQLRLGDNDLFVENNAVGAVAGGNASSWVVNDGIGSLHRQVNGNNYLFPVGTDSYTPLTLSLTNGAQDRFSVRVQDGVSREYGAPGTPTGSLLTSDVVDRTWVVSEEVAGGNTANITLQWNAADELIGFSRSTCAVANYSDPDWVPGAFGPAIGNGPFTRTITGLGAFRELCVADAEAPLNDIGTGMVAVDGIALHAFPNPASTVLHIQGTGMHGAPSNAVLIDATGRRVAMPIGMQGNVATIDVSSLTNGLYILELTDQQQHLGQLRVVVTQ
jgi:hypothetical protein